MFSHTPCTQVKIPLFCSILVHNQLNQLEKKGLIRKDKSTTRGIVILSPDSKQEEPKQASNVI